MKLELNEENARRLLFVANLLELEPERLLNDWMLSDWLKDFEDAGTGCLRGLYKETQYDAEKTAKRVAVRLMSYERQKMGEDFGLPEINAG